MTETASNIISIKKYQLPYTQVNNQMLNDQRLSLKAKGLYAYLFSKPDNWVFHNSIILHELKEGLDAFKSAIRELETYHYLQRHTLRNTQGRIAGVEYIFLEPDQPVEEPPLVENPLQENPPANNNTDIRNTDIRNTDDSIKLHSPQLQNSEVEDFCYQGAVALKQLVETKKQLRVSTIQLHAWQKELQRLYRDLLPLRGEVKTQQDMQQALQYLLNHTGETYCPVVESGKSFREKFSRIENQIHHQQQPPKDSQTSYFAKAVASCRREFGEAIFNDLKVSNDEILSQPNHPGE